MKTTTTKPSVLVASKTRAAFLILLSVGFMSAGLFAQETINEFNPKPLTESEIKAQELELKQKELELEKAKLMVQKSEEIEQQKTKLGLEIRKLELEKARRDLEVQETQVRLDMLIKGDVLFDVNSSKIKEGATPTLRQVALILMEYSKAKVYVVGYADSTGNSAENLKLSRDRAEAVKTYLLGKFEISSERVIAKGLGEENPVASNQSASGRQLNRRVEISLIK
ncbi:MAG: OmpA family protein [Verrucomicrobiota bacterium]